MRSSETHPSKPTTRTWRQDPKGRRARILEAAAKEFAEVGFNKARLARVAAAADVAEGTVYHQFESKLGLLEAIGEQYGAGMAQAAFSDLERNPSHEELARIVSNIFDYVRKGDPRLAIFLLSHDAFGGGPAQEQNRESMIQAIQSRLGLWIEHKMIAPVDTRIAAEIQFGLVEASLRDCFMRKDGNDEARYVREVTRCLYAYLALPEATDDDDDVNPR